MEADPGVGPASDERSAARDQVQAKRELLTHTVVYLVVNAFLVVVWAFGGAGYFWPIWSLGGWGIGLALHAWTDLGPRTVTEDDVDEELERARRRRDRHGPTPPSHDGFPP